MKVLFGFLFLFMITATNGLKKRRESDLATEIKSARERLRTDFIENLWFKTGDTIITSHYNILKLYTQSTIEQAQQVVEFIIKHSNITYEETAAKKKSMVHNVTVVDCVNYQEISTFKSYKTTGYNLHNCIRMAQIGTETKYLEILKNFEKIKSTAAVMYNHYNGQLNNCVDVSCVMTTLIQSVVQYEKLQEELAGNITEVNNLSSRYLLTNIAMGCVANSINQIYENHEIGRGLISDCWLKPINVTNAN